MRILQKIYKVYLYVWKDQSLIDILESQMMKIPFVEGWQYTKFNFRLYLLGYKEQAMFDKKHDALYEKDCIDYVDKASSITLPVFVVQRIVKGVKKGRAVVDLRPLNRMVVLNIYLLPLQQEIIVSIRGKKYIIVVDISNFFFQFPIHLNYRDRFIFINYRGVERSKVVLIRYTNSLLHA